MKKIIFITLICCCAVAAHAQYKKLFFNTLTVASGLPEPFISSSLQDKLGYMWFGLWCLVLVLAELLALMVWAARRLTPP